MGIDTIQDVIDTKSLQDLQAITVKKTIQSQELTDEKVSSAIAKLREVEKYGGYGNIARSVNLDKKQVKEIHSKMIERIAKLSVTDEKVIITK